MSQYLQLHFFPLCLPPCSFLFLSPITFTNLLQTFPVQNSFYNLAAHPYAEMSIIHIKTYKRAFWHFRKMVAKIKPHLISGLFICTSQCYHMKGKSTDLHNIWDTSVVFSYLNLVLFTAVHYRSAFSTVKTAPI